jgi:hypothetical protein
MPTLRVAKASAATPSANKLRVAQVTAEGAATGSRLRVARVSAKGTAPLALQPMADRSAEAFEVVSVSLGATSSTPDGYEWRQISGVATPFDDNGNSITFTAPPAIPGTTLVYGVSATLQTARSTESTVTIRVLPHIYWLAGASSWVPLTRTKPAGE